MSCSTATTAKTPVLTSKPQCLQARRLFMGTRGRRKQLKSISHFPPLLQLPPLKSNFISSFPSKGKREKSQFHNPSQPCPCASLLILPEVSRAASDSQQEKQAAVGTTQNNNQCLLEGLSPPLPKAAPPAALPRGCCSWAELRYSFLPSAPAPAGLIPISCFSQQVSA